MIRAGHVAAGLAALGVALASSIVHAQDLGTVKVGVLEFGTVNWELGVIGDGIDQRHGFTLKPVVLADKDATSVALLSGDVDAIVTDWIWVAKQRSLGRDFGLVWPWQKLKPLALVGWTAAGAGLAFGAGILLQPIELILDRDEPAQDLSRAIERFGTGGRLPAAVDSAP